MDDLNPDSQLQGAYFQAASRALVIIDATHHRIVDFNHTFREMLNLQSQRCLGESIVSLLKVDGVFIEHCEQELARQPHKVVTEIHHPCSSGQDLILELTLTAFSWEGTKYWGIVFREITKPQQANVPLITAEDKTRVYNEALVSIASDQSFHLGDLTNALSCLTSTAAEVLNVDRATVWQLDSTGETLTCLYCHDRALPGGSKGLTLKAVDYPGYFSALKYSRIIAAANAMDDPRTCEFREDYLRPLDIHSMLDTPIRLGGKLAGVVCYEQRTRARLWSPEEQTFAAGLGDLVALALSAQQRRELEHQLRQMLKMESVGRLAGGIAHDFNNILQAIHGYTTMLIEDMELSPNVLPLLNEMKVAVDRARKMNRKLLAMSRSQPIVLEPVNINQIASELRMMLSKLLPSHMLLEFLPGTGLPKVAADSSMIEQVIMNLVVNARDAIISEQGRIVILTRFQDIPHTPPPLSVEARPGSYVVISVEDNGGGMDDAVKARLFEPFFTTKPLDQGTGLGLSIVYGIIKQHLGWIEVKSQVGVGTTFEVFLPVLVEGA